MTKLKQLIDELCPNGVEIRDLENCCNILDKKRKPITKSAREAGEYPYYGANGIQDYVSDYIFDGTFILVGEDGSVLTPEGTPVVNWAEGKIWVNNHAHIIEETDGVLLRYIYHYLQTIDVRDLIHGNIPKLTQGDFRQLKIAVPPLPVQSEIVRILDNFTELTAELIAELAAELTARKQQYEHYREILLTFSEDIPLVKLGELCSLITKGTTPKVYQPSGIAFVKTEAFDGTGIVPERLSYVDKETHFGFLKRSILQENDILFTIAGATIGKCAMVPASILPANTNQALAIIRLSAGISKRYVMHILYSRHMKEYIQNSIKGSAQPNLNLKQLNDFVLPVPPIAEQERIVAILDHFNALSNDITQRLSTEIEARKKQYEYYRDKLLTFKELDEDAG